MSHKGSSITKSAFLVTAMMLAFKVFAFLKQAVIAYYYGATIQTDSYFIAWGFVSGISEAIVKALSVSLVAVYTGIRVKEGKHEASKLINGLLELFLPIFLILSLFIFVGAPIVTKVLAPSYQGESAELLTKYIRILAPVIIFGCFELVFSAILDSNKSFYIPRIHSFIYSALVILACVLLSELIGVNALVAAQYASNITFTIMLLFAIRKYHLFFLVKINEIPELKSIIVTAIPLFIGNSALQINQIVDKSITSGLGEGAASALSYCHTLEQFVTNIMIVNIGNVIFANFAEFVAKGEKEKIKETLSKAINIMLILLFATAVITIIFSKDIVTIVYFRGSFTYDAVVLTAMALTGYAFSFPIVAIRNLTIKSLYAHKDTKHPMFASLITIAVNIILSVTLSKYIGILGISIATSIAAIVGMIINARALQKYLPEYKYINHLKLFVRCIPAAIILIIICICIEKFMPVGSLVKFITASFVGFGVYFAALYISGVQEIKQIISMVKHKFFLKGKK